MKKYAELLDQVDLFCFAIAKTYGPYLRPDGRKIVVIKDENGNSRTVSYPKYLMEQHLNKVLDPDKQTIDHWDSNKDNNDLSNLRIIPRDEHSREDTRRVKLVKFKCNMCDKEFERSPRRVRDKSKKRTTGIFCSRNCSGRYSRKLQLKQIDRFPVQPYVESEYYKKKYIKADLFLLAENLELKYGAFKI